MNESLEELQARVNDLILQRTRYGRRIETAERAGYRIGWSNGNCGWFVYYYRDPRGAKLDLDANVIFVPGARKADLEYLADNNLLEPLPLYRGSHEARERGECDFTGIELPPMIRMIRDFDLPRESTLDRALEKKAQEN
jgi:hypothetical protein